MKGRCSIGAGKLPGKAGERRVFKRWYQVLMVLVTSVAVILALVVASGAIIDCRMMVLQTDPWPGDRWAFTGYFPFCCC